MKKLLFFIFLSCLSFSNTCNWVSEPNQTLKKYIGVIKKHNLTSKVYCDNNDNLMVYWRSNDENDIDIGLMLNDINAKSLSLDEAVNAFNTFVKKIGMFDEVKLSQRKGDLIPENVNICIILIMGILTCFTKLSTTLPMIQPHIITMRSTSVIIQDLLKKSEKWKIFILLMIRFIKIKNYKL